MLTAVLVFTFITLSIVLGSALPVLDSIAIARGQIDSKNSYFVSEAGIEDLAYRIQKGKAYNTSESVPVGTASASVNVADVNGSKALTANANVSGAVRLVQAMLAHGVGADFNYGIQVGTSGLSMDHGSQISGNVYSNQNITGSGTITGSAVAVGTIENGVALSGTKTTGATASAFPSIDVAYWESQATTIHNGDENLSGSGNSIGNLKIVGNLVIDHTTAVSVTGPVYVTGNITLDHTSQLVIDSSLGSNGTVIVADGKINLDHGSNCPPTATTPKGYLLLISTNTADDAISLDHPGTSAPLLYAPSGGIQFNHSASAVSLTAKKVTLDHDVTITYDTGLIDAHFSSGPSGGWVIGGWGETQ